MSRELEEEKRKVAEAQQTLEKIKIKILTLKMQIPVERFEEMETVQYYRDPRLERKLAFLKNQADNASKDRQSTQSEIDVVSKELVTLETQSKTIKLQLLTKEVTEIEKDPKLEAQTKILRKQIKQIKKENYSFTQYLQELRMEEIELLRTLIDEQYNRSATLSRELTELRSKFLVLEKQKYSVEIKIWFKEIFVVQPETANEIARLKIKKSSFEKEIHTIQKELFVLKSQKLVMEYKEIVQKILKLGKSPEAMKEIESVKSHIKNLEETIKRYQDQKSMLIKERDYWKEERSQRETKVVNRKVMKYENDPVLIREAEQLRQEVKNESQQRKKVEDLVNDLKSRFSLLERRKPEERKVVKEVVHFQKDPKVAEEYHRLSRTLDIEVGTRRRLDREVQQLRLQVEEKENFLLYFQRERENRLGAEKELRKITLRIKEIEESTQSILIEEVVKVERDPVLEKSANNLRSDLDIERTRILSIKRELKDLQVDILEREKTLENTIYKEVIRVEKDEVMENKRARLRELCNKARNARQDMEDECRRLKSEIENKRHKKMQLEQEQYKILKHFINEKEKIIQELKSRVNQDETQMREIDISTKISFLDQITGKKMSPYEAYKRGLIDRQKYIQLRELECDWEEISTMDCSFPIAGVYDTNTNSKYTVKSAVARKLLDPTTGQKLLEAQAATGGIIDIISKDRYSVNKAIDRLLVDGNNIQSLLSAQKAFIGMEDPVNKKRLSVGEAVQKGLMSKEAALPYLIAQHLTGGLIDPKKTGRIPLPEATEQGLVTKDLADQIQDESTYKKNLIDPSTKEKINYKEAIARCWKDPVSGLLLLEGASESYQHAVYHRVNVIPSLPSYKY